MSNLLVQNIKHTNNTTSMSIDTSGQVSVRGEGSATTTNLQQGLYKQWIHFPADLASLTDSFNVTSLTDSATGVGVVNINNDMANADYAIFCTVQDGGSDSSMRTIDITNGTVAAGSYGFNSIYVNSATNRTDNDCIGYTGAVGDLA